MERVKGFSQEKEKYLEKLRACKSYVEQLEKELDTDFTFYKEKLERAIQELNNEKIKIVLFGSFSDGKSTILAALTGNLCIEVAPEPTTDKIQTYTYNDFFLVDTPGLFSENIPHDELTKKFISEADLIIFTTDAVNPLKESQHEVIKWILKDLRKLPQTVFVINKMDTIADLYSKEDFQRVCNIKKEAVRETLNKILSEERKDYLIVCLSTDPWGMGLNHWFQNKEEYKKLSNIEKLEDIINHIAEEKKEFLKKNTIKAILRDISTRSFSEFKEKIGRLEKKIKEAELEHGDLEDQLNVLRRELKKAVTRIRSRLNSLRETLVADFHACNDFECLKEILDRKLGKDGNSLKTNIEIIIEEEIEALYEYFMDTTKILEKIAKRLEEIEILNLELMKLGPSIMKKTGEILHRTPTNLLRNAIIKTRNFLKLPIKFKPWQAVKLAKALQTLGVVLETLTLVLKIWRKIQFEEKRSEIIKNINSFFSKLDESITPRFIKENYFPSLLELEKAEQELATVLQRYKELLKKYREAQLIFEKCAEELR